jgi:hypothetical protein
VEIQEGFIGTASTNGSIARGGLLGRLDFLNDFARADVSPTALRRISILQAQRIQVYLMLIEKGRAVRD